MKAIRLYDEDRPAGVVIGAGETEESAIRQALSVIGTDYGPLDIRESDSFDDFADRVADAFGGDTSVSLEVIANNYHADLLEFALNIKAAMQRYHSASISTTNGDGRRFSKEPGDREGYEADSEIGQEAFDAAAEAFNVAYFKLKGFGIDIEDIQC